MKRHPHTSKCRGFTFTEIVTVLSIIAILAAIAIPIYGNCLEKTRAAIARNLVETVNSGIHRFNEVNYELLFTAVDASAQDEMVILRTLQYRNPNNPALGAPYVRNNWNPVTSTSTNDYRLVWTGSLYKLVSPGQAGNGLKVNFDGSDLGLPYNFPPSFSMAGK